MSLFTQYDSAQLLEQQLGDPMNPENVFSFRRSVSLDEQDAYPVEMIKLLNQLKVNHYYIPARYGGRLRSFEEALAISRVVARRDLTATIAYGVTYLGALPIWIGGAEQQKHRLAEIIKRGEQVAFGLTEKNHGSDILATETEVIESDNRYLLSGEKWLIGNATRSSAMSVFSRTQAKGGGRGFTLFMVEKTALDPDSYDHLAKIKTLGLRGADISGIRFQGSILSSDTLIGQPGSGLELVLKTLQITRTLHACTAPSLGQADTALRVTLEFALTRQLYGGAAWDIDHVRRTLVETFIDILICECMAIAAARAIHVLTDQLSLISSILKYFVPSTIEDVIHRLSGILGARHYLREDYCFGIFQKILRDHAIISVFDGSSAVNLHGISLQLPQLVHRRIQLRNNSAKVNWGRIQTVFNLEQPLGEFKPEKLALSNRGDDDIIQGVTFAQKYLHRLRESSPSDRHINQIISLTDHLIASIHKFDRLIGELDTAYIYKASKSSTLFNLAQQYCTMHAAAYCLQMWVHNRNAASGYFSKGEYLILCLSRLMQRLDLSTTASVDIFIDSVSADLLNLHQGNQLFSIIPFDLASGEFTLSQENCKGNGGKSTGGQ